ncbi:MAG: iron-containing alcohol dehydrogenase, partial [Bradymonadaceae bacterium]
LAETGGIAMGDGDPIPFAAVPTTLAGADLSIIAGISASADGGLIDEDVGGGLSHPELMPTGIFYDPAIVATPKSILAGSALNGFNKGLETIYSKNATPITDATAAHGIERMADGLRDLADEEPSAEVLEPVVEGLLLVQYGIGRPGVTTLSLMHAFGHTLRDGFNIQQGTAHAVITPDGLRYLFSQVDGRRELLADALGVGEAEDKAEAVAVAVAEIRDDLDLPSRLRDLPNADRSKLPDIAAATIADSVMAHGPEGLDATVEDIEELLENAW